jgi:hypothetical protein
MRGAQFLIALLFSNPWAVAVAQDYEPRHGFWIGAGLGFGAAFRVRLVRLPSGNSE